MKVKKTGKSKWGFYVMDENSKFTGCTEQVSGFLSSQLPCEIEIEEQDGEGNKVIIKRIKVLGSSQVQNANEFEQPVETVKPGETKKVGQNYYDTQTNTQKSIKAQFCVREGIKIIEEHNKISDDKIEPNMANVLNNAKIIWNIVDSLLLEESK